MPDGKELDNHYMAHALALALDAKGRTWPNPAVGAVVVRAGKVVGTGKTAAAGGDHAEKVALRAAGSAARGATLYVTLEPCCHTGRTPPCTEAIIAAGIRRVVAAVSDPNPRVRCKGLCRLRRAGITVETGVLEEPSRRLNEDFFWWVTRRRTWFSLKLAMTLDARIAAVDGVSRWITSVESRTFSHELRRTHEAVAVGRGTVEADDPLLTVRHVRGVSPVRILFSTAAKLSARSRIVKTALKLRTVVVSADGREGHTSELMEGIEVWHTGRCRPAECVKVFAGMAYEKGIQSVLIEGGQRLAASFLEAGLVNRLYAFYANKIIGRGIEGISFGQGYAPNRCLSLLNPQLRLMGPDIMVTGLVKYPR